MTWAGENSQSGLMTFSTDGSPGAIAGSDGHILVWQSDTPSFVQQSAITGVEPVSINQIGDVDTPSPASGEVLGWNGSKWIPVVSSDENAIHDNVAGEISSITEKTVPASGDLLIIEDSQAGNVKKKVQIGNLPGGAGSISGPGSSTDNAITRWNGTGGTSIQNSEVRVSDSGNIENPRLVVFRGEYNNGNSGSAATINWNEGQKQKITLNGSPTLTFVHPPQTCNLLLKIVHDAGGGPVTWPTGVYFPGGTDPSLTNVSTAIDIVSFYYDGLEYFAIGSYDFL